MASCARALRFCQTLFSSQQYLGPRVVQSARGSFVIHTPTLMGVEKLLEIKGVKQGTVSNYKELIHRVEKYPRSAIVTDSSVLMGGKWQYHAIGVGFERYQDLLMMFIYDSAVLGYYRKVPSQMAKELRFRVSVLENHDHRQYYNSNSLACTSYAICFVKAFLENPGFFEEVLKLNQLQQADLMAHQSVEKLPKILEDLTLDNAEKILETHINELKSIAGHGFQAGYMK